MLEHGSALAAEFGAAKRLFQSSVPLSTSASSLSKSHLEYDLQ